MAYWSPRIANELIKRAEDRGEYLTPLQLIKLVYVAHGFSLARLGRPLTRDKPQAWRYGPVYRSLYSALKEYRSAPVLDLIPNFRLPELEPDEIELLEAIYNAYGKFSGVQLSSMTHKPGTPWYVTWESKGQDADIEDALIREHYIELNKRGAAPARDGAAAAERE